MKTVFSIGPRSCATSIWIDANESIMFFGTKSSVKPFHVQFVPTTERYLMKPEGDVSVKLIVWWTPCICVIEVDACILLSRSSERQRTSTRRRSAGDSCLRCKVRIDFTVSYQVDRIFAHSSGERRTRIRRYTRRGEKKKNENRRERGGCGKGWRKVERSRKRGRKRRVQFLDEGRLDPSSP